MRYLALAALLLALSLTSAAATSSYSIPTASLEITVNTDGSATLEYNFVFHVQPEGDPKDHSDIGLPTEEYDLSKMKATLDGHPASVVKSSTQGIGPAVRVNYPTIMPGKEGKLYFTCKIPNMVYQDTTDKTYASLRITPTWFNPQYVKGTTNLAVVVYLPRDIKPEEVKYQLNQPFTKKGQMTEKTVVGWGFPNTSLTKAHEVGLSFPKRGMKVIEQSTLGLAWKWWSGASDARIFYSFFLLLLTAICLVRLTGGTGCVVFGFTFFILLGIFASSPVFELVYLPILIPLWVWGEHARKLRRAHYLPAIASVAGGGIKRGLTVPEAAVTLEQPLGRVLTLIIFGLLKKGLLKQVQADPLIVQVTDKAGDLATPPPAPPPPPVDAAPASAIPPPPPPPPGAPAAEAVEAEAPEKGLIRAYEKPFLEAIAAVPGKPITDADFKAALKDMVTKTAKKLAGFNLDQTKEYYQTLVSGAWAEAQALGDLQKRTEYVDDNLEWLMLDNGYGPRFHTWYVGGYNYSPPWTRSDLGGATAGAPAVPGAETSLGDVGASFAGRSENLTGKFVSAVDPVSVGLVADPAISGGDHASSSWISSVGGGGGGSSCACACAGCACACACAGGGD